MSQNPQQSNIELLAPAGTPACLKAACIAGADAVYLAGKRFGARAFAGNFDEASLRWARRVTSAMGKKLYITLNTIVFEHEFSMLEETLDFYEALQPDALIIQDLGAAVLLKQRRSTIARHLSTQGAWFGQGGAEELKELGFTRVILPREMSFEEISELKKRVPDLELEMFVHGAMCYSISGRCFWSASLGTRSGNRGTCAQPCRREYRIDKGRETCLFSPRDLRLVDQIDKVKRTGVSSLKIEGRMKSPEYVYQTVKAYRMALDSAARDDKGALDEVFSRSASCGFFSGPLKDWRTGENPGREGILAGVTTGRTSDGMVEIKAKNQLKPGDGVFWFADRERCGGRITWVQADKKRPEFVLLRGIPTTIKAQTEIRRSSQGEDGQWEQFWNKNWERRPVKLFWSGHEGLPLAVETVLNGHRLRLETEEPLQLALKQGLEGGALKEKFSVLGELFKSEMQITTMLDSGLHINPGTLKKLKRQLVESLCKLEQLPPPQKQTGIIDRMQAAAERQNIDYSSHFNVKAPVEISVRVWNKAFPFVRDLAADSWILPWEGSHSAAEQILHTPVKWWLPPVLDQKQFSRILSELSSLESGEFLCFGWEAFEFAKQLPKLKFSLDWCFNVCNLRSLDFIRSHGLDAVFSKEWKPEDIPVDLHGTRAHHAWNPLVSFSRFIPSSASSLQNSHGDKFFMLPLGNGTTGLFLEDRIASVPRHGDSSLQIDVALAPNENPVQAAKDLNRILESYKQ